MLRSLALATGLTLLAGPVLAQETRLFIDDLGREVQVPVDPQRIVSLGGKNVTVPLIELGVIPVGSQGTQREDGSRIIRASGVTTGVDFDNSDIVFVGDYPVDIEAVAALEPDLIIWPDWQDGIAVEQLEALAPTVAFFTDSGLHDAQDFFAELVGAEAALAFNRSRYERQIAQIRALVPEGTGASVIQGVNGQMYVCHTYSVLGGVLREAGFTLPDATNAIGEGDCQFFSAESIQEFDADWVFITYRTDREQTPADAVAGMESVLPVWCDALTACREGRVVYLPRAEATTPSYDAAMAIAFSVLTHLSQPHLQPGAPE